MGVCTPRQWAPSIAQGPICVPSVGCTQQSDCDDFDPNTYDGCILGDGSCVFVPVASGGCGSDEQCFPTEPCQRGVCNAGTCSFEAIPGCEIVSCDSAADCDDGFACTVDACINDVCRNWEGQRCCDTSADCAVFLSEGGPLSACSVPICGADRVCHIVHTPDNTFCGGGCETDTDCQRQCDPDLGTCDSICLGDDECYDWPCMTGACSANGKCVYFKGSCQTCEADGDCVDADPCTLDTCDTGACVHTADPACAPVACSADTYCDSGDPCVLGVCTGGNCIWLPNPTCD